jgi:hypothetical protein
MRYPPIRRCSCHPTDGTTLALILARKGESDRVCLIRNDESGFRELWRAKANRIGSIEWSRDGRSLLFVQQVEDNETHLWRIPAAGGEPEYAGLSMQNVGRIQLNREGTRIAFGSGTRQPTHEYWALDNLGARFSSSR